MPTILTHAAVPLAIGLGLGGNLIPRRLLMFGVVASMLPDLDVLAFRFHIAYADTFGHRGVSHSMTFAVLVGLVALLFCRQLKSGPLITFVFIAVCAASHGLLDMFTNGGYGVALWWPFSADRLFAPWQVIDVSPLSLRRVFSARGLEVLQSEILWVWVPALLAFASLALLRRHYFGRPFNTADQV
jgi:inner membrane protein